MAKQSNIAAVYGRSGPFTGDQRIGKVDVMRPWQRSAFLRLRDARRAMLSWATGSGKTACASALAAHHAKQGRFVVFAAPELALLEPYGQAFSMAVQPDGSEYVHFAGASAEQPTSKQLRAWLQGKGKRPAAVAVTHSTLRNAVGKSIAPVDCFLVLDEAHHARDNGDESNVLGTVVRAFADQYILAMTASPFRSDEEPLLPPEMQDTFEVDRFSLADLLAENKLEISVRVVAGPMQAAIDTLCATKARARIVYVPHVSTNASRLFGGKLAVRDAVAAATKRWTDEPIVDLVQDDAGRADRVRELRQRIASGRPAKTCVALNLLREGWDSPETDDLVVLSTPDSLTMQTQLVGRVTRRPSKAKERASVTFCVPTSEVPKAEELELFLDTLAGVLAIGVQLEETLAHVEPANDNGKSTPERAKRIRRALRRAAGKSPEQHAEEWAGLPEVERLELASAFHVAVSEGNTDALGIHVYQAANGLLSASCMIDAEALRAYARGSREKGAPWTPVEDDLIRAGIMELPGRTQQAVFTRRKKVGVARKQGAWTAWLASEDAAIMAGARTVPGRTYAAVLSRRSTLGMDRRGSWTAEEDGLLRAGAMRLPGRTAVAVRGRRCRLRIHSRPFWSDAENALLRAGAKELPGRTSASVKHQRYKLGLTTPRATRMRDAAE